MSISELLPCFPLSLIAAACRAADPSLAPTSRTGAGHRGCFDKGAAAAGGDLAEAALLRCGVVSSQAVRADVFDARLLSQAPHRFFCALQPPPAPPEGAGA